MNTSFKANAAQHKAFIADLKETFCATTLSELKDALAHHNHDWAINDVITIPSFEGTGKYFVVRASDLLVSSEELQSIINRASDLEEGDIFGILSKEELIIGLKNQLETTLIQAPARNSIGSLIEVDSTDDAYDTDNSLDDDSHLFYADNTVLVSADDDTDDDDIRRYKETIAPSQKEIDEMNDWTNDWLTNRQHEDALQAAKILFHYWALSGNELPLPNHWASLFDFVEYVGKIENNTFVCPAREDLIYTTNVVVDNKQFFLWENTYENKELFFQTLENLAVNYGVQSWFTREDILEYQQNYRIISENCQQVIEIHEQSNTIADNGIGEYLPFPTNTNELHNLVATLYNTKEADQVIHNCIGDDFLFFQVLATMNFINSTASTVEA